MVFVKNQVTGIISQAPNSGSLAQQHRKSSSDHDAAGTRTIRVRITNTIIMGQPRTI